MTSALRDAVLEVNVGDTTHRIKLANVSFEFQNDVREMTHRGSLYREFFIAGPARFSLNAFVVPSPAPLTDREWKQVSGIVQKAGTVPIPLVRHPRPENEPAVAWATINEIAHDTLTAARIREQEEFLSYVDEWN